MKKKICIGMSVLLLLMSLMPVIVWAEETETVEVEKKVIVLSADEAVSKGLENSIDLKKLEGQVKLAAIVENNATKSKNDIIDANKQLTDASWNLSQGIAAAYSGANQLDSAQVALDNGIAPQDITLPAELGGFTIPAGKNMRNYLETDLSIPSANATAILAAIVPTVQLELTAKKQSLNSTLGGLENSILTYTDSRSKYDSSVTLAMASIGSKLGTSTITSLAPKYLGELLQTMAKEQNKVTAYSQDIYKNQIAMLIRNNYYNALKEESILTLKAKSKEMAEKQLEFAQESYKVGAKAKDDMLLATAYYNGCVIEYNMQEKEYQNALIELKKSMNIALDTQIELRDTLGLYQEGKAESYELSKGIESGLKYRMEMKMGEAQIVVYTALGDALKGSSYSMHISSNQYNEASILLEKANLEQEQNKKTVESSIRQSYKTMQAVGVSLAYTDEMLKSAKESAEIAKFKYEEGYGIENALLQKTGLVGLSGTIVEVINAEQNVLSIEEKIIELKCGYNMARAKYLNDIGILAY